jgi:Peptidase inhibitor family I36
MRKKLAIVFAAVVTAAAFAQPAGAVIAAPTGSTAATAHLAPETTLKEAATTDSSCEASYLCFWVHADYLGPRGRFAGNNPHWSSYPQSQCQDGNWNDCASSAKNRGTSCTAHLHQHSTYGGDRHSIGRGGNRPHLSAYGFNDKTSSNSWC